VWLRNSVGSKFGCQPMGNHGCRDGLVVDCPERRSRDGITEFRFEPLDFLTRLAALVPRPQRMGGGNCAGGEGAQAERDIAGQGKGAGPSASADSFTRSRTAGSIRSVLNLAIRTAPRSTSDPLRATAANSSIDRLCVGFFLHATPKGAVRRSAAIDVIGHAFLLSPLFASRR
jgi:hypothetical protein